ncbi:MAG: pyridoxine 5-phosphate synthase [Polyangiales bacterium]|jgi:pyridoxine 5-phosphate synthase
MHVALSVNVDHVATVRQARGARYPDPVRAALLCETAGADGITIHLREDRRHAQDRDVEVLRQVLETPLNLETALTKEMLDIACRVRPELVTLVPERREERTTEGGLNVVGDMARIREGVKRLNDHGIRTSLFIDPDIAQCDAALETGAAAVELHTGEYAHGGNGELTRLAHAAEYLSTHPSLYVAAGHGLTTRNVSALVAALPNLVELNIGHALIADAIFVGLEEAVARFRSAIDEGESRR